MLEASGLVRSRVGRVRTCRIRPAAQAFADPAAKAVWFAGPDEWKQTEAAFDFREGGRAGRSAHVTA